MEGKYHNGAEIRGVEGNKVYVDMESISYGLVSINCNFIFPLSIVIMMEDRKKQFNLYGIKIKRCF